MSMKGRRKYRCMDCGNERMQHWVEQARAGKEVCSGCGGRFWEPASDGALEREIQAGTARAIQEKTPPHGTTGEKAQQMRGEREIRGTK